ncbi:MAG: chemotaxis protein CheW [Desulfosporosinus sp.]|jgi:purine-binding chemotaxis protein CheW
MVSGVDASSITGVVKIDSDKRLVMILEASRLCKIDQTAGTDTSNLKIGQNAKSRVEDKVMDEVQLVSFLLGNEEFALEIKHVREIIRYPEIVKVPNMPDYIKGVISLRDTLMPIIDMRIKLGTSDDTLTANTRVVVVDVNNIRIGLIVDQVYEVARIAQDTIFSPPQALVGDARDCLKGIVRLDKGKRLIMLLEPGEIMTTEELQDIGQLDSIPNQERDEEKALDVDLDEEHMVVFKLAGEQYGVRITQVQEINRLSQITKVPRAAKFVEGVVNLRGDVIPVIDLRKRFEIEFKDYTEFTRIIVSDINNKKIGIIVDEVLEVLRIPRKLVEETPDVLIDNHAQFFMNGIAKLDNHMIMMLNLENILVEKEWQKIADLGQPTEGPVKKVPKLKKQGRED